MNSVLLHKACQGRLAAIKACLNLTAPSDRDTGRGNGPQLLFKSRYRSASTIEID